MKRFFYLLVFVWLGTNRAAAWSYGEFVSCHSLNPMPAVTFKTSYGQLVHDFNLTTSEITSRAHLKEKGFFADGLAVAGPRSAFRLLRYTVRQLDDNATCVLPAEVLLRLQPAGDFCFQRFGQGQLPIFGRDSPRTGTSANQQTGA